MRRCLHGFGLPALQAAPALRPVRDDGQLCPGALILHVNHGLTRCESWKKFASALGGPARISSVHRCTKILACPLLRLPPPCALSVTMASSAPLFSSCAQVIRVIPY